MLLKIHKEQFESLDGLTARLQVARTCQYLRKRHSSLVAGLTEQGLAEQVEMSLSRAKCYGIQAEPSLRAFALLWVTLGPGFDLRPEVHTILTDQRFASDTRVFSVPNPNQGVRR